MLVAIAGAGMTGCAPGERDAALLPTAPSLDINGPPVMLEYELQDQSAFDTGSEVPPTWFDSTAALVVAGEPEQLSSLAMANYEAEVPEIGDARSDHIAAACQGEIAAYNASIAAFVGSAGATIVGAVARNISMAWTGAKASAAALIAVNVARAHYNGCAYREGRAWDDAH